MKKIAALLIIINGFTACCAAQFYIEPVTGYQTDLNNKNKFKQISSALQLSYKKNRHYELILQLQKTWPVLFHSNDSSFTPAPALPVYANAVKTIRPSSFSFSIGHRISLFKIHSNNVFSVVFFSGINFQKIEVSYQYDKNNYTILNPDRTIKRTGLYLSGGVQYMRLLKYGRLFIQLIAATPPAAEAINYPSSFDLMAPLSFNAGYSIPIKINKHAKK